MNIVKNGSQPSAKGNADWFTGSVRLDPLFAKKDVTKGAGILVTFEPGARTAWHTHPAGQTLLVVSGLGWVQKEGGLSKKLTPAMSSGLNLTKSIGMAHHLIKR